MTATDIIRRRRARAERQNRPARRLLRVCVTAVLLIALVGAVALVGAAAAATATALYFVHDLPNAAALEQLPARAVPSTETTRLYAARRDADGAAQWVLIDEIADPRPEATNRFEPAAMPQALVEATLALEAPDFFAAPAPGLGDIWTALTQPDKTPSPLSPITQALIDDLWRQSGAATADRRRPAQDRFLARQIDRRYGREQMLARYLDTRYYGSLAYGPEAAARVYFGKPAADLTTGEAIWLAVIAGDPARNPHDDPAGALTLLDEALTQMVESGALPAAEAEAIRRQPPAVAAHPADAGRYPAFARLARRELEALVGPQAILHNGLRVYTTLDLDLQEQAVCVAAAHLATLSKPGVDALAGGQPSCPARVYLPTTETAGATAMTTAPLSASVAAIDPRAGVVRALTGSALSPRPMGTMMLPLVYLTALSEGYSAATQTLDVPTTFDVPEESYRPGNADGRYRGPLRLRQALAGGYLTPAVQVLSWLGTDMLLEKARLLGLDSLQTVADSPGLSIVEEGAEAGLLDLTYAYGTMGNMGSMAGVAVAADNDGRPLDPAVIERITDRRGEEVYVYAPAEREILAPQLAYLMNDLLSDRQAGCEATDCQADLRLPDNQPAAASVGTAEGQGGWTIGHTPALVVGVYVGNEAEHSSTIPDGRTAAAPIWRALMGWALAGTDVEQWSQPAGMVALDVCDLSGLLPRRDENGQPQCPTVREVFVEGTQPTTLDDMYREIAVNRETGRLATVRTLPLLVERRSYVVYPPEAAAWAEENDIPQPPAQYDPLQPPAANGDVAILSPEPNEEVTGPVVIRGVAAGEDFAYYRLAYFPGLWPEQMQPIVERGETPVQDGELGMWDTSGLDEGVYTLLLTVVHEDGTFEEAATPVTISRP